jgi:hypothetical protein
MKTGGAMTGAITTNSTFDGRDVSTDGTKLDGIEALADVTDTANVTAAGALMDSELTDIAAVKALDQGVATTNSPTFVNMTMTGTGSVKVPAGTTVERDGVPVNGMFRYNSTNEQFEGYQNSEWGSIGGGGGSNTFTTDTFVGDGITTDYALSQVINSEDNLMVFIAGVFQQQSAYTIATASGTTTLTFSTAPVNTREIVIYSIAGAVSGTNLNVDLMTGDGTTVAMTLSITPVNENNTQVFIDGVYQSKSNYSISGTTLTFSTAPPNGTAVEVMTMNQTEINVPVDGTVTSAKLDTNIAIAGTLGVGGAATFDGTATMGGLTVDGDATLSSAISSTLQFKGLATSGSTGDSIGRMEWYGSSPAGGGAGIKAAIETSATSTTLRDFDLVFKTGQDIGAGEPTASLSIGRDGDVSFYDTAGTTAKMVWDASAESLGIGTTLPAAKLHVDNGSGSALYVGLANSIYSRGNEHIWQSLNNTSEYGRFDASGNLLVGTTSTGSTLANTSTLTGAIVGAGGNLIQAASNDRVQILNRLTSDGDIVQFRKDGTTVGRIGTRGGDTVIASTSQGVRFYDANSVLLPTDEVGAGLDATISLGQSDTRWKDLYLSNSAIVGGGGTSQTGVISFVADSERARIEGGYQSGGGGYLKFNTDTAGGSNLERMRIDSAGNVLFNATSTSASQGSYFQGGRGSLLLKNSTTSPSHCLQFINPNGTVGQIFTNGSATTYSTSSDYRLKEDAVPMTGATERVKALRPINFAWKVDGSRTDGFFAHEAQEVVPECSTGSKDAMRDEEYEVTPAVEEIKDEDGNVTTEAIPAVMGTRSVPDYQGIDQSKLVPLLTATIQELIARIEALEGA